MSRIHPSAVIEDGAQLGEDCTIGPFCVIGPHVRLGNRCNLHSHVVIDGHTTLGDENVVYPFACLGKKTQDLKYVGGTCYAVIGDRNEFREYVTVNTATTDGGKTVIGSDCLFQSYCHIAHECILGDHIIMTSDAMLAGHIEVGDHAVIMGKSGGIPFVRIGTMGMIGGYSKLDRDLLPYCIAEGIPAEMRSVNKVKMERCGLSSETVRAVYNAFKKIIRSGLTLEKATAELEDEYPNVPEVQHMIAFARASQRGLARPKGGEE